MALKIGGAVAKQAATAWLRNRRSAHDRTSSLADLAAAELRTPLQRNRLELVLKDIAQQTAEQLGPLVEARTDHLPDNEVNAALDAVCDALSEMDLSDATLLAADMDPERLSAMVRASIPDQPRTAGLSEAGTKLYDFTLNQSCRYFIQVVQHLAIYPERALTDILGRLTALSTQLTDLLVLTPRTVLCSGTPEDRDADYRAHYLNVLAGKLDRLELLGIPSRQRIQLSLSLAYLSLSATRDVVSADEPPSVRVETALADSSRILVRGEAGSGKSTLVDWLAVTAARGHFVNDLTSWNGSLPLPVRLRRYTGQNLPGVDALIDHEVGSLLGRPPEGWIRRQLLDGRCLLLIDGVDEVSAEHRPAVRGWLTDLMTAYPRLRVVVTSRPSGVAEDWLDDEGFRNIRLEPMNLAEIAAFIARWHEAASQSRRVEPHDLAEVELRLVAQFETRPHLRMLAGTPLLCAVLCALNLERAAQLPQDRMALYQAALDMLLGLRDEERGIRGRITARQRLILLRDLAWRLTLGSRVDLEKEQAVRHVARKLPSVVGTTVEPTHAMTDLLDRSGVLREPVEGRVDFIHRTFQEYLAAAEAVDDDQIDTLLGHVLQPDWRETVMMAAGHANRPQLQRLLRGVLDQAQTSPTGNRYLHVLATGFLETAGEIPVEMHRELDLVVRTKLVPPNNWGEAMNLARLGPGLLDHLPMEMKGLSPEQVDATIRAAALCGNHNSIDILLRRLARTADERTGQSLVNVWEYYDAERFAREVLTVLPPRKTTTVYGARHVPYLKGLPHLGRIDLCLGRTEGISSLSFLDEMKSPRSINASVLPSILDLAPLRNLRGAHSVAIRGAHQYQNLDVLRQLPDLRTLTLELAPSGRWFDIDFAAHLATLSVLNLDRLNKVRDFTPLSWLQRCVALSLVDAVNLQDLRPLGSLTRLRILNISGCGASHLTGQLAHVTPKLTHLVLNRTQASDLRPLMKMRNLEVLSLLDCPVRDLTSLAVLPLRQLSLNRRKKYRNMNDLPADVNIVYG
ncbi:NACHT domain-containing protein [Saccharothrix isguenensis]